MQERLEANKKTIDPQRLLIRYGHTVYFHQDGKSSAKSCSVKYFSLLPGSFFLLLGIGGTVNGHFSLKAEMLMRCQVFIINNHKWLKHLLHKLHGIYIPCEFLGLLPQLLGLLNHPQESLLPVCSLIYANQTWEFEEDIIFLLLTSCSVSLTGVDSKWWFSSIICSPMELTGRSRNVASNVYYRVKNVLFIFYSNYNIQIKKVTNSS